MTTIKTQPIKWHGGKSYLAKWIHSLAPPSVEDDPEHGYTHRNIVFAGGMGEFWNWLPIEGISEAVNDRNEQLTNFFGVLSRVEPFRQFSRRVVALPLDQNNWDCCKVLENHPIDNENFIDRALDFFVRYRQSRQGLGKDYATPTTRTRRGMNENVSAWLSAVEGLPECHERLRRVEIRNLDFEKFIAKYDHPRALFYCDPPYLHETRTSQGEYGENEMDADQHWSLLALLSQIEGKFMISGYRSELYDDWEAVHRYTRHEREIDNKASSKKTKPKKTECVWTNY